MDVAEIIVQIERILRVSLTILFTYLLALWIAAVWWTFQDIRSRSADVLLQLTATLLVAIFSFPGLLIYFLLRPQRTLAELYDESLEEEALLRTMHGADVCPNCEYAIEPDFLFCPNCQARLRQPCQRCERPILLRWHACPYCGTAAPVAPTTARRTREPAAIHGQSTSEIPSTRVEAGEPAPVTTT